jgi:hypothetical protein
MGRLSKVQYTMNKILYLRIAGILVGGVLFFGMLMLLLLPHQENNEPEQSPRPVPTTTAETIALTKLQLISLMPVVNPEFRIEYYKENDEFLVTILQSPYAESRAKAEEWLHSRGIDKNKFKLTWSALSNVE